MLTGTLDTFTMPSIPTRASTRGNTICLFSSSETILWTFAGGRSTTLDISHLGVRASTVGGHSVLFHPLRNDVLFLSHAPGIREARRERLVSEYKDGVFVKLHRFEFPEQEVDEDDDIWQDGEATEEARQINDCGDYALRPFWYFFGSDEVRKIQDPINPPFFFKSSWREPRELSRLPRRSKASLSTRNLR